MNRERNDHIPDMALQMREACFPGKVPVDAYGNGGFRFADMSHIGSLLCLPSGIYSWDVTPEIELTIDLFSKVLEESDQLELFLIGTGHNTRVLSAKLTDKFHTSGVSCDAMNTGAAVRTYNVLLAESRAVGAAFIAV